MGGDRMSLLLRASVLLLTLATTLAGCGPGGPGAGTAQNGLEGPLIKKRVVAAFLRSDIQAISALPTDSEGRHIASIVHGGFAMDDDQLQLHAQLAEAVPTLENGLWKLLPDGRMETTWKLKPTAKWHDGVQITTADLLFGMQLEQDPDLALRSQSRGGYDLVEGVDAVDALTVTIRWKRPYIEADVMFGSSDRLLPKHILEQPYVEDKARFADHPYWTDGFIGAGPFKLKEYVRGDHVLFEAFDDYLLGRPRLDEIEVRFIADSSTMIAQLLAGAVDTTLGLSVAPDQVAQVKDRWRDGQVVASPYYTGSVATFPQMVNPTLPIVLNPQFRRALLYAVNRDEMVETIMLGQGDVSHTVVSPALPEYAAIQDAVVRYGYDPRRSAQILEELGYRKGIDGLYEDAGGQRLSFEHWGLQEEQERVRAMLITTDYWKTLGLDVRPYIVPAQQASDRALVAQFPAFLVSACAGTYDSVRSCFHSSQARTQENRFAGSNRSRWMNTELDAALDRFSSAIPFQERVQALREAVQMESDQAVWMGLFYFPYNTLISNRLENRRPDTYRGKATFAHLWDVK